MASHRPGYARHDTDADGIPMSSADPKLGSSSSQHWTQDEVSSVKSGKGVSTAVKRTDSPSDDLPAFEGFDAEAENKFGVGEVVSTVCSPSTQYAPPRLTIARHKKS